MLGRMWVLGLRIVFNLLLPPLLSCPNMVKHARFWKVYVAVFAFLFLNPQMLLYNLKELDEYFLLMYNYWEFLDNHS